MKYEIETLKIKKERAKRLKSEILELEEKIVGYEELEEERILNRERKSIELESAKGAVIDRKLCQIQEEFDRACSELLSASEILRRARQKMLGLRRDLESLDNVLSADKNLAESERQLSESWSELRQAEKASDLISKRRQESADMLEAARVNQREQLDQAILAEIESGESSQGVQKSNRELLDEIDVQERRIQLLDEAFDKKVVELKALRVEHAENLEAFKRAQMYAAEKSCIVALEKFSPFAHKYVASSQAAGYSANDFTLIMDSELLDKESQLLAESEAKLCADG